MPQRKKTKRKVWAQFTSRVKKCGTCKRRIKGPARNVGGKPRCYWCNKKLSGF